MNQDGPHTDVLSTSCARLCYCPHLLSPPLSFLTKIPYGWPHIPTLIMDLTLSWSMSYEWIWWTHDWTKALRVIICQQSVGRQGWISDWGQPGLQIQLQNSQGHTEKACLKTNKSACASISALVLSLWHSNHDVRCSFSQVPKEDPGSGSAAIPHLTLQSWVLL